jgi:hypothetical protein
VPYVVDVDSVIDLPGGINVPMVVRTTDSYGNSQKQLVKSGNDDLRQDAVMQQFFGLINDLLSSSAESQQRQLSLRTYRWAVTMFFVFALLSVLLHAQSMDSGEKVFVLHAAKHG